VFPREKNDRSDFKSLRLAELATPAIAPVSTVDGVRIDEIVAAASAQRTSLGRPPTSTLDCVMIVDENAASLITMRMT
jgi:hypothetical protein